MAQVALIGHSKPKTSKVKARISNALSDHAVANSWWSPAPACVVEQRILRSEDSTSTQDGEGPRNNARYASLPALRSVHPLGPTSPAPTPLAGAGEPGGGIGRRIFS